MRGQSGVDEHWNWRSASSSAGLRARGEMFWRYSSGASGGGDGRDGEACAREPPETARCGGGRVSFGAEISMSSLAIAAGRVFFEDECRVRRRATRR